MPRTLVRHVVRLDTGPVIVGAKVEPLVEGTTTAIGDAFATETGGSATSSFLSNAQGEVIIWIDTYRDQIDLRTSATATSHLAGSPGVAYSFTTFTETVPVVPLGGVHVQLVDTAQTVTVGATGNYATISAALAYLGKKKAAYVNGGFTATISLLTGFVMAEQIVLDNVDFSWVTITSVDAEVNITRSTIPSGQGAWYAIRNAKTPRFACFFRMDATGAGTGYRLFDIMGGSHIEFMAGGGGGGNVNRVLQVIHGSVCVATAGVIIKDSLDIGIRVANASQMSIPFSTITNNVNNGVAVSSGAIVQMANSTCTGSVTNISVTGGAIVSAPNCNLTGAGTGYGASVSSAFCDVYGSDLTGGGAFSVVGAVVDARTCILGAGDLLRVLEGGVIQGTGFTGAGALSQTANQFTKDGIIWDNNLADAGVIASKATVGTGSAAAPTVTFTGRTTDGVYSKGAGQVGLAASGVERAYASSDGFTATILRSQNGTGVGNVIIAGRSTDGRAELALQNNTFSANNARLVATTNQLSIDAGGVEDLRLVADASTADGETAILLRRNVGGTYSVVRVSMGAVDSGGTGFKVLRVPN